RARALKGSVRIELLIVKWLKRQPDKPKLGIILDLVREHFVKHRHGSARCLVQPLLEHDHCVVFMMIAGSCTAQDQPGEVLPVFDSIGQCDHAPERTAFENNLAATTQVYSECFDVVGKLLKGIGRRQTSLTASALVISDQA